jgi:hypothetical protein
MRTWHGRAGAGVRLRSRRGWGPGLSMPMGAAPNHSIAKSRTLAKLTRRAVAKWEMSEERLLVTAWLSVW